VVVAAVSATTGERAATLIVEGLAVGYDAVDVLRIDHLHLPAGSITALLGPNGAGKTTLLQALAGLLPIGAGTIRLGATSLTRSREGLARWRATVGLVMHEPDDQLFGATVCEDVAFGPVNLGLPRHVICDRVDAALEALDLEEWHDWAPHTLSHGQKLRTAIAGIIAMHPSILLLDEPTSGLDAPSLAALEGLLGQLRRGGRTLLVATHDVDSAWRIADAVIVLQRGRVHTSGSVQQVLGSQAACDRAGVTSPAPVALCERLRALGLVDDDAPPGRTVDEVLRALRPAHHTGSVA